MIRQKVLQLWPRRVQGSLGPLFLVACLAACGAAVDIPQGEANVADSPAKGASVVPDQRGFEELRNEAFVLFDREGSTDAVWAALSAVHTLDREAYGVNLRLAQVCAGLRRDVEALHHYELALGQRPHELGVRRELVDLAISMGREERALELVDPLLDDPSWAGEGTALKARALSNLGRRAEALALLEGTGDLPVAQATACLVLHGRILHEMGEHGAAYERFAAALALAPDNQAAVKGLADTSRRLGRDPEADRWDEVLQLFLALRDNRFTRAASPAADRKGQRMAGRRSDYIGDEQAAQIGRLRRMIALHPRWPGAWEQLAALQRREGDLPGACLTIQELMTQHGALYDPARRAELQKKYCHDD